MSKPNNPFESVVLDGKVYHFKPLYAGRSLSPNSKRRRARPASGPAAKAVLTATKTVSINRQKEKIS